MYAVGLPASPLYPQRAPAQGAPVHLPPAHPTGSHVRVWLLPSALPQNGVPRRYTAPTAFQASLPCRLLIY